MDNELYDIVSRLKVIEKDCLVTGATKGNETWSLVIKPLTEKASLYDVCYWLRGGIENDGWTVVAANCTEKPFLVTITREAKND